VALIGSNGVQRMLANQQFTFTHTATTLLFGEDMVLRLWLPGLFGWLLVALAAIGTLYLAYHYRQKSAAHIFAIGLLGSLLVAPYIRIPDLVLWLPAALLMRRGVGLPAWLILFGLIFTFLPLLPDPVVPLVALLVLVYRSESARKTSDRSQSSLGPVAAALEAR
jgi:hypothetical protein